MIQHKDMSKKLYCQVRFILFPYYSRLLEIGFFGKWLYDLFVCVPSVFPLFLLSYKVR